MKDLFTEPENIPDVIANIFEDFQDRFGDDFSGMDYSDMAEMHQQIEAEGYTFDSYLDNVPFGLRPLGVELKELEGYENL